MKKSSYRSDNEIKINYFNHITAMLDGYGLEKMNILRTDTFLYVDKNIEHFVINVTIPYKAIDEDVKKFFNIMEQNILPGYMKSFYNTKDFKVKLFDESGKTEEIVKVFKNNHRQIEEEKSEEEEI